MKTAFKPLGLAAAVAAVTAGYTGVTSAQEVSNRNLGDLALIPYYTVQGGFATAIHITNTTSETQVVKLRARRALDSMDALDFNIVLSPEDQWVGSMTQKDDSSIVITTNDNSCTAPAGNPTPNGGVEFVMPDNTSEDTLLNYREGAEEGYIEIIGMGQPLDETFPLARAALHDTAGDDEPADCTDVRRNFFRVSDADRGTATVKGVHFHNLTSNGQADGNGLTPYVATPENALMVSWAITDGNAGLEVGGNAVHINGFTGTQGAMMSNQQVLVVGGSDALGYLFPDLDGGPPGYTARGAYDSVIRPLLGVSSFANDWSSRNSGAFTVSTDWIVTMPGQYTMLDPVGYNAALALDNPLLCLPNSCDWRDIPVDLSVTYRNREEEGFTPEEGGLVVSPAVSLTPDGPRLVNEVNVIEWVKGGSVVFDSEYSAQFEPIFDFDRGWALAGVTANATKNQAVWNYLDPNNPVPVTSELQVPVIGFAAWERNFTESPDANYGRAVEHSYGSPAVPVALP